MVIGALRPASAWAAGSFETVPQGLSAVPIQAVQSICNTPVSAIAGIKILHAPGGGKLLWVEVEYPEVIESGVGAVFAFVFKWLHDYLRVSSVIILPAFQPFPSGYGKDNAEKIDGIRRNCS